MGGVFLDVYRVRGNVGNGQEVGEFADDAVFIVGAVVADFLDDLGGGEANGFLRLGNRS